MKLPAGSKSSCFHFIHYLPRKSGYSGKRYSCCRFVTAFWFTTSFRSRLSVWVSYSRVLWCLRMCVGSDDEVFGKRRVTLFHSFIFWYNTSFIFSTLANAWVNKHLQKIKIIQSIELGTQKLSTAVKWETRVFEKIRAPPTMEIGTTDGNRNHFLALRVTQRRLGVGSNVSERWRVALSAHKRFQVFQ